MYILSITLGIEQKTLNGLKMDNPHLLPLVKSIR